MVADVDLHRFIVQIAVHCHAGYGRTGIAIASIMIALRGMTGLEVITQIRARR